MRMQARILELERELKTLKREQELGITVAAGTVSQQKYDEMVATNQRLKQQLEVEGGMGSHTDLQELQAVKRDVLQMKRERDDLKQRYEEQVLKNRQLQESPGKSQGARMKGCMGSYPHTDKPRDAQTP